MNNCMLRIARHCSKYQKKCQTHPLFSKKFVVPMKTTKTPKPFSINMRLGVSLPSYFQIIFMVCLLCAATMVGARTVTKTWTLSLMVKGR